jgi:regulatory protein
LYKQLLTPEQALQKAKHYCAWQERCHSEVKEKLYSYGLKKHHVDILLTQLIEENYLNEERYAQQFTGGHFRMKQWGRIKIRHELKQKGISDYLIKKSFREIDEDAYLQTLQKLVAAKWKTLKGNTLLKNSKVTAYLLQKGFENPLIQQCLKKLSQ